MKIEYWKPQDLTPYFRNTKDHPTEQVDKIAASIAEFKFDQPIVVDESGVIIKGHGRREAALRLKLEKVPVIVRDDLSEAQKKASRIADNKTAESSWLEVDLAFELEDLKAGDYDITLTGFNLDEINIIRSGLEFDEGTIDDQPKLDAKKNKKCPECGHEF